MNSLKLFPFMPKGILSTDEEVNSATASGMYHVTGDNGISVVLNYSIMIVFNDERGYVIQWHSAWELMLLVSDVV